MCTTPPRSEPQPDERSRRTRREALSEAAYLRQETVCARQAISGAVDRLRNHAREIAQSKQWVEKHPWLSVGVAAFSGFVVAKAVTPAKGESVGDKLSRLKMPAALRSSDASAPAQSTIAAFVGSALVELVRVAFRNWTTTTREPTNGSSVHSTSLDIEFMGEGGGI